MGLEQKVLVFSGKMDEANPQSQDFFKNYLSGVVKNLSELDTLPGWVIIGETNFAGNHMRFDPSEKDALKRYLESNLKEALPNADCSVKYLLTIICKEPLKTFERAALKEVGTEAKFSYTFDSENNNIPNLFTAYRIGNS